MTATAARRAQVCARLFGAAVKAQGSGKLVLDIGVADARGARSRDHQHVARRREIDSVAAKEFAHQAADAVARRRPTDLAAGGDAQPRRRAFFVTRDHDEVADGLAPALALQRQKLVALAEPEAWRKALRSGSGGRGQLGCLGGIETVNRLRPLARRRLRTSCPPGVLIRARKPCVRLRRLLLGW